MSQLSPISNQSNSTGNDDGVGSGSCWHQKCWDCKRTRFLVSAGYHLRPTVLDHACRGSTTRKIQRVWLMEGRMSPAKSFLFEKWGRLKSFFLSTQTLKSFFFLAFFFLFFFFLSFFFLFPFLNLWVFEWKRFCKRQKVFHESLDEESKWPPEWLRLGFMFFVGMRVSCLALSTLLSPPFIWYIPSPTKPTWKPTMNDVTELLVADEKWRTFPF